MSLAVYVPITGPPPRPRARRHHNRRRLRLGHRRLSATRAIVLNPNCGWARGKTDVFYVADAFQVMQKVNELLGCRGVPLS